MRCEQGAAQRSLCRVRVCLVVFDRIVSEVRGAQATVALGRRGDGWMGQRSLECRLQRECRMPCSCFARVWLGGTGKSRCVRGGRQPAKGARRHRASRSDPNGSQAEVDFPLHPPSQAVLAAAAVCCRSWFTKPLKPDGKPVGLLKPSVFLNSFEIQKI